MLDFARGRDFMPHVDVSVWEKNYCNWHSVSFSASEYEEELGKFPLLSKREMVPGAIY